MFCRGNKIKAVASRAVREYGHLDTWVQAAAVSIYATFEQTTPEEFERVIDVNLIGAACSPAWCRIAWSGGESSKTVARGIITMGLRLAARQTSTCTLANPAAVKACSRPPGGGRAWCSRSGKVASGWTSQYLKN